MIMDRKITQTITDTVPIGTGMDNLLKDNRS